MEEDCRVDEVSSYNSKKYYWRRRNTIILVCLLIEVSFYFHGDHPVVNGRTSTNSAILTRKNSLILKSGRDDLISNIFTSCFLFPFSDLFEFNRCSFLFYHHLVSVGTRSII